MKVIYCHRVLCFIADNNYVNIAVIAIVVVSKDPFVLMFVSVKNILDLIRLHKYYISVNFVVMLYDTAADLLVMCGMT